MPIDRQITLHLKFYGQTRSNIQFTGDTGGQTKHVFLGAVLHLILRLFSNIITYPKICSYYSKSTSVSL